jgi:type IX secretion system PorP/SprF family membrane protein
MRLPFSLLFVFVMIRLQAQQTPQYSLYAWNPYQFNPAYAGMESTLTITGVYRQQWSGLEGAPVSQYCNAHLPVYAISSGAGIRVSNESAGAHARSHVSLSYNCQIQAGTVGVLSVGTSLGYQQYVLDGARLRAPDGIYTDSDFSHNDALLPLGKQSAATLFADAGVYFRAEKWSAGISFQPVLSGAMPSDFGVELLPHGYLHADYRVGITEGIILMPSILVKTDLVKTQADISAVINWRESTFAGFSFRGFGNSSKDAFVLLGGLKMNERTTILYAFDVSRSSLGSVSRGSHELLLRYSLNKPVGVGKLPPVIYNPRFF